MASLLRGPLGEGARGAAHGAGVLDEKFNLAGALRNKYNKEKMTSIPLSDKVHEALHCRSIRQEAIDKKNVQPVKHKK